MRVKCFAQERKCPGPGPEPGPLDLESSALTMRPPRLPAEPYVIENKEYDDHDEKSDDDDDDDDDEYDDVLYWYYLQYKKISKPFLFVIIG